MAASWHLEELSTRFFKPFQASAVTGYFRKEGVLVEIPQYPRVYKVFTAYQAFETLYNIAVQPVEELTPTLVQKHLVQFRKLLHILRPDTKEGSRRKTKHAYPPLPATALWIQEKDLVSFAVFGIGKAGKREDKEIMDREMAYHCQKYTKLDLENQKPASSTTFFNCSEYRPFLAASQLSSKTQKRCLAQCLTVSARAALQMCQDCRDNALKISIHHGVEIIDRYMENVLIQENIAPSLSTQGATYASTPLKQPYAITSSKEEESSEL